MAENQCQISPCGVSRHHHIPSAIAQIHQIVPRLSGIVHRSGKRMLRSQTILKTQGLPSSGIGQLGSERPGISQISAGIASTMAVKDHPASVEGPIRLHPGSGHPFEGKGLPLFHDNHRCCQPAQKLLPRPLLGQILRIHGIRCSNRVNGL